MVKVMNWEPPPDLPEPTGTLPEGVTIDDLIPSTPLEDVPRVTIGETTGINPHRVRAGEALRLRQQGLTYREIGARLGRTQERARQLVLKAERIVTWAREHGREPQW